MKQKIIVLIGAPGSGKGTQAKILSQEFQLPHISTGDLMREEVKKDSPQGREIKKFQESGLLAPDEFIVDLLFNRTSQKDCERGFLLDGFPRKISQGEILQQRLPKEENEIIAIYLHVHDDVIIDRAAQRRTCGKCGAIYNLKSSPPANGSTCDVCNGELLLRNDDLPEVVKQRLIVYHDLTEPLIDYYKKQGCLHEIDGEQTPEQVFQQVKSIIG